MIAKHTLKKMAWLSKTGSDSPKVLHLRTEPGQPWRPYTMFPNFRVPDHRFSMGSQGFATFQKLLQEGWELVPTDKARQLSLFERQIEKQP